MTTTTEPRRRPPAGAMRDLGLYLIAALAVAYLVVWWALGRRTPPPPVAAPVAAPAAHDERSVVDARPPGPQLRRTILRPARVAPSRRGRIRTRSS